MFRGNVTTVSYGLLPIHNSGAESIMLFTYEKNAMHPFEKVADKCGVSKSSAHGS